MARLDETVERFRGQLLAREEAARRAMVTSYRPVLRRIEARSARLLEQIERRRATLRPGQRVPISWLYEAERLEDLRRGITREVRGWSRAAEAPIRAARQAAATFGPKHAEGLIASRALTSAEFVRMGRIMAPFRAAEVEAIVASVQAGSPLRDLLDDLGPSTARSVEEVLVSGIALGEGPARMAAGIADALGGNLRRGELIARTEVLRTYREATRQGYLARADLLAGWRWWSSLDRRTCASCWAQHGTLHPLEESLDDHPAGRCTMIPELDEAATGIRNAPIETGEERFAGLDAAAQRAIVGPGKAAAIRAGEIRLGDLSERVVHPRWGSMRRVSSLERARARAGRAPEAPAVGRAARRAQLADELRYAREAHEAAERQLAAARTAAREAPDVEASVTAAAEAARLERAVEGAQAARTLARDTLKGFDNLPVILEDHPSLAALGERLVVTSNPRERATVAELHALARVDPDTLREVADAGYTLRLDTTRQGAPEFPGWEDLRGVSARGQPGRLFDTIGGAHSAERLELYVADTARSGSSSTLLHEFGHALAHVRRLDGERVRLNEAGRLSRAHRAGYDRIAERGWYYSRGQPGGRIGVSESLAEGFADAHMLLGEGLERQWGAGWAAELRRVFAPRGRRRLPPR